MAKSDYYPGLPEKPETGQPDEATQAQVEAGMQYAQQLVLQQLDEEGKQVSEATLQVLVKAKFIWLYNHKYGLRYNERQPRRYQDRSKYNGNGVKV